MGESRSYSIGVGAYYIVTDLDIRARFDLAVLDTDLRQAGLFGRVDLHQGVWRGGYSGRGCCGHPAEALDYLLQIVEGLGTEARMLWDQSMSRRFDLGFECFDERLYSRWQVKAPLLRRLAEVNGDLVITIYRDGEPIRA